MDDAIKDTLSADPSAPENGEFKMPPLEKLLEAIESMANLSPEKKAELVKSIKERAQFGQDKVEHIAHNAKAVVGGVPDFLILFGFIALIFLVIVFFGYKLYRSLTEKERRREEKRRQKQQKKKK